MKIRTILLVAFLTMVAAVIGLQLLVSITFQRSITDMVANDLREITRTVHFSTQLLSSETGPDREDLLRFIKQVRKNKDVTEVSIINSNEEVVESSDPRMVGTKRQLAGHELVVREEFGLRDSTGRHVKYEFKIPLIRGNKVIGLVVTSIVANDIRYQFRRLLVRNLAIGALSLLAALLGMLAVLRFIDRPLQNLCLAAEQVATGNLGVRLSDRSFDEIDRLNRAFNRMVERLRDRDDLADRVAQMERRTILAEASASAAHEIRNPLNLINLTVDHLAAQFPPADAARAGEFSGLLSSLKAAVQHLDKVVGDFLALGRPAKLVRSQVLLADLLTQCRLLLQQRLSGRRISLDEPDAADGVVLQVDRERFQLALLNLLLNSLEAVPEGGTIRVSAETGEGKTIIAISDNGPGIPEGDRERIFEPYVTSRPGGTGLGLALVRRIVEEHGGTVAAANGTAGGAVFTITLPRELH